MNDVWIAYLLTSRDQFGVDTDPMQKMQSQSELGQNHNKKKFEQYVQAKNISSQHDS